MSNPTNPQQVPTLFSAVITAYMQSPSEGELSSDYRKAFYALFDMDCETFIGNDHDHNQVIIISRPPSEYPTLKVRVLCDSPYRLVMSSDGLVYGDLSHE